MRRLTIYSTDNFSKDEFKYLSAFSELESLELGAFQNELFPELCAAAGDCPTLPELNLNTVMVNDACLEAVSRSKSITKLTVDGTEDFVTDAGIEKLGAMKSLKRLRLETSLITNKGLKFLHSLTGLQQLKINRKAKITREGIDALLAAIPKCKIQWGTEKFDATPEGRDQKAKALRDQKPLSAEIWKQVQRLGGKKRAIKKDAAGVPKAIHEFLTGVTWPKRKYSADLKLAGAPFPLKDMCFTARGSTDAFDHFPSCQGRSLIEIGEAQGCYIIALDLKSKTTDDPKLEIIDTEDFEEECMYFTQPLSKFLARLS